jgi:hypothetical protein
MAMGEALATQVHKKGKQMELDVLADWGQGGSKKCMIESLRTIKQEEEFEGMEAIQQPELGLVDRDIWEIKKCRVTEVCLSSRLIQT